MKESAIAFIVSMLLLTACSKDNDETVTVETPTGVATVTYLVTPNGLGDNSYNDAAAEGIFAFAHVTGTRLRMLQPKDEAEAGTMYRQWLTDNATKDSAVLIIGSSAYEAIARQTSAAEQDRLQSLKERGGRVLLFESDADIEGISTVIISRYGVSYLAGAMSQNFNMPRAQQLRCSISPTAWRALPCQTRHIISWLQRLRRSSCFGIWSSRCSEGLASVCCEP